jgi:hypothetical protein
VNVPIWAADLASRFWIAAGRTESFPRKLRGAIAWALPDVTVVSLSDLRVAAVVRWLDARKVSCRIDAVDRPLHGMLATVGGCGFIFLDSEDGEDERRFTLAHELAHYLRDEWRHRERVRRHLGESGVAVLEGKRLPTDEERLLGALEGLPLDCRTHLLERLPDGRPTDAAVPIAERDADRLAFELLAPAAHVAQSSIAALPRTERPAALRQRYGLPDWAAGRYAQLLDPEPRSASRVGWLRQALQP